MTPAELVRRLQLMPHPEGGWYRETWRAAQRVRTPHGPRSAGTAILYCLATGQQSALHRIASDEVWHHVAGGSLHIRQLHDDGSWQDHRLGPLSDPAASPQVIVPGGAWFGARPLRDPGVGGGWVLSACTVAPGFDFADFTLASAADLTAWPRAAWDGWLSSRAST